ncbi:TPA: hypothetical protein ACH3X2_006510 [Trebouxia sp. C0005]
MGPRIRTLENTAPRSRDMMQTRTHPLLATHNAWTWKFLPGIVVGFVAHWWLSQNREQKTLGTSLEHQQHDRLSGQVPPPDEELKMVMCVNTELKMRAGKIAAQCAHAAVAVVEDMRQTNKLLLRQWEEYGSAKIAVKCPNQAELLQVREAANAQGIPCHLITDAGRTQIAPGSKTVLAIGPWGKSKLDELTGHYKLL